MWNPSWPQVALVALCLATLGGFAALGGDLRTAAAGALTTVLAAVMTGKGMGHEDPVKQLVRKVEDDAS